MPDDHGPDWFERHRAEDARVEVELARQRATKTKAFRWEGDCLADDPFAGDFGGSGCGDRVISDKMVTNRGGGVCHNCHGDCQPGTRNRVRAEIYDGELMHFRWCQLCSFAMAVYALRPSIADRLIALGDKRRAEITNSTS